MKKRSARVVFLALIFTLLIPSLPTLAQQEPENPNQTTDIVHYYLPMALRPATVPAPPPSSPAIIDHTSVALFERIPVRYLNAARGLKTLISDRSVGYNFSLSLDCLAAPAFGDSPSYCRKHYGANYEVLEYNQAHYNAGVVPPVIHFTPSPTLYNRSNWEFVYAAGDWSSLTCNFIQELAPAHMDKQVLSYQFSYLNVGDDSGIMGFWQNNPNRCDIYDLEAFMAQHRDKVFILWTSSLSRSIGTRTATDFNNQMRLYARQRNLFLMDFAAIESYTHTGQPCYDNRDGVPFTSPSSGNFENYPNDGLNLPAICQDYTTETDGGHLGSTSGARIRTIKAFWVLMARVAGWDGVSP